MKRPCTAAKINRHAPDFTCDKGLGHTDAHRDALTGIGWKHPMHPYGMRGPSKPPSNRSKTKHGVSWSDRPARQ